MKLITYKKDGRDQIGVLDEACREILPIKDFSSMNELIESGIKPAEIAALSDKSAPVNFSEAGKRPPIPYPKQDIICLGMNYTDHLKEITKAAGKDFKGAYDYAVYFSKRVSETVADGGFVSGHWDIIENTLDYEAELALIIGKDAYCVPKENAYEYVFGYTVFNDISARNIQTRHKQYYFGKSLDSFCPMGPWIVTEDEFARPPSVGLRTRVNGEVRQDSSTDMMIFDIPHIISELSSGITLKAGTIISTGTPAGVGLGFAPPRYLKPGDVVECEIDGIGILKNIIK